MEEITNLIAIIINGGFLALSVVTLWRENRRKVTRDEVLFDRIVDMLEKEHDRYQTLREQSEKVKNVPELR